MLLAAALVLELARESLTGTHYRYREYVNGLPTDEYVTTSALLPARGEKVPKADEGPLSPKVNAIGGLKPRPTLRGGGRGGRRS